MKDQLVTYKTQYDIRADYNRKGLLEAQKVVYHDQIDFSLKVEDATQRYFALKPLQIGFVQSLILKDDPKFKQIQKTFVKYNAQVKQIGQKAVNGLHLKTVVMESMLKFLRIIMLAPDQTCKKNLLDVAYYWFIKHLNPKTQRKTGQNYIKQIKEIVTKSKQIPLQVIQKQLPSQKLFNDLYQYKMRARTMHNDRDAPQFQLQNYRQKQILVEPIKKNIQTQEEKRRIRLMRLKFPKPNLQQYYQPQVVVQEEKVIDPLQPPVISQSVLQPLEGAIPKPEQNPLQVQSPEMLQQLELLNQMGGQPDEPEQQVIQQDDDKKKGKLDPLVKIFLRKQQQQKASKAFQHPPINYREKYKNNYKQLLQRQDQNFSRNMQQWANTRSKLKTEMGRKIQSMRMFNYSKLNKTDNKFLQDYSKTKVNQTLNNCKYYIKKQFVRDNLNTQAGLSCFDRKRAKTQSSKPFSTILQQNKRINKRQEYLDQIDDIKQRFAKNKIYTSMHIMKNGLMHPQQQTNQAQTYKTQYPVSLLSNPFFVVKKKKKKGKKKK